MDGSFDGPLEGSVITLLKDGVVLKTTATDADGNFSFTDLAPGSGYQVTQENLPGYLVDLYDTDGGGFGNLSNIGPFDLVEDLSFANETSLKFVDFQANSGRRLSETKNLRGQQ